MSSKCTCSKNASNGLDRSHNKNGYIFFCSICNTLPLTGGCMSQWSKFGFVVDGVYYKYAEQYMMAEKARLFGDEKMREKIMRQTSPMIMKRLGRAVSGFDEKKWSEVSYGIVLKGNFAKFSQNENLKEYLLSTGNAVLAEANPRDTIWGIGMTEDEAIRVVEKDWKGRNLLGKALMEVREMLRQGDGESEEVKKDKRILLDRLAEEKLNRMIKQDFSKIKSGARSSITKTKEEPRVVEKPIKVSYKGPTTNRRYIDRLKRSVVSVNTYEASGKVARKAEIRDHEAATQFAKLYKPFVFGVLQRDCYFQFCSKSCKLLNGKIDAEEVFHEVFIRFFRNTKLKDLDLTKKGAGKTPFRNYLREIVKNTFSDMAKKDLVDEIGPDGKPVLVEVRDKNGVAVFETDEKGNVKKDAAGRPVFKMKPRQVARFEAERNVYRMGYGERLPALWAQRKFNIRLQNILLDIVTLAYIEVHEDKACRNSWTYEAMAAIFERGEDDKVVMARLISDGIIKNKGAFYTAKSRFDKKWHDTWMKLYGLLDGPKKAFKEDALIELWRSAKVRIRKLKNVDMLRKNIAEWALDYAQRATERRNSCHERHHY